MKNNAFEMSYARALSRFKKRQTLRKRRNQTNVSGISFVKDDEKEYGLQISQLDVNSK